MKTMSLEDILNKLTITDANEILNKTWIFVVIGVIIIAIGLIAKIKAKIRGLIPIIFMIIGLAITIPNIVESAQRPLSLSVQISVDENLVSVDDLEKYFSCSNVSTNDGKLTCNITPKFTTAKKLYDWANEYLKLRKD